MSKYDKIFSTALFLCLLTLSALMAENVSRVLYPLEAKGLKINVDDVKIKIKQAGLEPREATFWVPMSR